MEKFIMSLDLGTTSARCVIFDKMGRSKGMASRRLKKLIPQEGMVEQSPDELLDAVRGSALEALLKAKTAATRVEAIGITNQRETVILWDRATGEPVANAFSWQCNRGAAFIEALTGAQKEVIREKTGLVPSPYFSASKIAWALENIPDLRRKAEAGEIAFGTPDSWLIYKLTGGKSHLTDYTNASRTMLFNIDTLAWDDELLEIFNIPKQMLPEALPSVSIFGMADVSFFGAQIPITGVAGDQQSALFGQCCFEPGDTKATYGTGCFVLMNTGKKRFPGENGLLTTLSAGSAKGSPEYALEGSVFMCGSLFDWLRDALGIVSNVIEDLSKASELPDNGGVYMVPALTGLGAPYWDSEARGLICGLGIKTGKEHIIRAALEGIAFQAGDVISAIEKETGQAVKALRADGGVGKNIFLMQFQSDITDKAIVRPAFAEITARGAAFLAGLGCGFWSSFEELKGLEGETRVFEPDTVEEERKKLLDGWKAACSQSRIRI